MSDWVDSLSDAEVAALYKYKQGGVDALSDNEVKLMYPHKDKLNSQSKAGVMTGIKSAFAGVGNTADTTASILYGTGQGLLGNESGTLQTDQALQGRIKSRNTWANPDNQEIGLGGKLAGAAATLPMQMVSSGLGSAETGYNLLQNGESVGTALGGAAIDAAGNIAGMVLPGWKEGSALVRGATGAAANAAQDALTKTAIGELSSTDKSKKQFSPSYEDALVAGLIGGGTGVVLGKNKVKTTNEPDRAAAVADLDTPKETPQTQVDPNLELYKQQAQVKYLQAQIDRIKQGQKPITVDSEGRASVTGATGDLTKETPIQRIARELDTSEGGPNTEDFGPKSGIRDMASTLLSRDMSAQESLDRQRANEQGGDRAWEEGRTDESLAAKEAADAAAAKEQQGKVAYEPGTPLELTSSNPSGRLQETTPESFPQEQAPTSLSSASDKISKGQRFSLSSEERISWDKARIAIESVMEGARRLTDKEVWSKINDREWVQSSIDKIKQKKAMFDEIASNSKDRQAVADANRRREVLQEHLDNLQDSLQVGRPDRSTKVQGPITKAAIRAGRMKGAGGGFLFDFGKKKERDSLGKIPGVSSVLNIKDLQRDKRTNEEFLAQEKNTKDVEGNFVQRFIKRNSGGLSDTAKSIAKNAENIAGLANDQFTKGSFYQAMKTGNSLVKRVGETIRDASNKSRANISEYVHGKLYPAANELSVKERTDIVSLQQIAETKGKVLSEDYLASHGFNEKQIAWWKAHTEVMKKVLDVTNEALEKTGHKPISPRVSYLASMADGDFRRIIYKMDGDTKTVVSILGADSRGHLDTLTEKLKAAHPEYHIGEEKFFGDSKRSRDGSSAIIEMLSNDDPNIKLLADHVSEIMSSDAHNYMNAKSHTMAKKGILGMRGRKEFESAENNAKDAMQAQIDYAEKMFKWAEMMKATESLKPLLHPDNGLDMPNAKKWSSDYLQTALGNNPSELGRAIDDVFVKGGKALGIGPSVGRAALMNAKRVVNGLLIGFFKPTFLFANLIQPGIVMPGISSFLKGRGLDKVWDGGTGASYLAKGAMYAYAAIDGKKLPDHIQGGLDYAKDNHVYSSDLFDANSRIGKGVAHYWDKFSQLGTSPIEMRTRQTLFLGVTEMLHENGIKKSDGLYEIAHDLTEAGMNNYNKSEAAPIYNSLGAIGKSASNLSSYKHNEYSRMAMYFDEIARNKSYAPLAVAFLTQLMSAGLTGTMGYTEANELVKLISEKMGHPTSITKVLFDNPNVSSFVTHGMFANIGLDMSNQIGTGGVAPQNMADALMPGATKLGGVVKAGYNAVTSPSEYNTKLLAREVSPGLIGGVEDLKWFSKHGSDGTLALNKSTGKPTITRDKSDILWKIIGATGVHEAKQKELDWENTRIDKVYKDMQNSAVDSAVKSFNTTGVLPPNFGKKFIAAQGNPDTLDSIIQKMAKEGGLNHKTAQLFYDSANSSITSAHKLMRQVGQE